MPSLYEGRSQTFDIVKLVNSTYELLNKHQGSIRRREDLQTRCVSFLPSATWLRQGNVSRVCHSVHLHSMCVWQTTPPPPGQTPPGQTPPPPGKHPPRADTTLGRHPLGRHTPLGRHLHPVTATSVDGTHPTGMHSCSMQMFH